MSDVLRYAAFTVDPAGGNPAGVVLDATGLDDGAMQRIATEVDYAETAFVTGRHERTVDIRYFSPIAEVPFCGHATIATAVALIEHLGYEPGVVTFETPVGPLAITTTESDGDIEASFTSIEPSVQSIDPGDLSNVLGLIGLTDLDLDPRMPPMLAFAGNTHPVIVIADAERFDRFTFDPAAVRALMDARGWAGTVTIVHPLSGTAFEARNLFPVGRITEDPATGSAAAAFGAYLRALGLVEPPATIMIVQGRHVGRPSTLVVEIPDAGGITVSGHARTIV